MDASDDGEDLTAAEYALGVLDGEERAAAEARSARDPAFARETLAWVVRFAPFIEAAAPVQPSAAVWERIATAVDRSRVRAPPQPEARAPEPDDALFVELQKEGFVSRSQTLWRAWAVGASLIAAGAILFIALRPPAAIKGAAPQVAGSGLFAGSGLTPSGRTLVATLGLTQGGAPALTVAYDPALAGIYTAPDSGFSVPRAKVAMLWLIPANGKPMPMGVINPSRPAITPMPAPLRPMMVEKAALAITIEPAGGAPGGAPTGPAVAAGRLSRM